MSRKHIALLFGGFLFAALPALAQVNLTGTSALTISANPVYPGPNSIVQLTAESPLLDLDNSVIQWTVNGKTAGTGESVNVTLGPLGKETDVDVSVSGASGNDSATLVIVPASLDLLWEADSYVPPFYKGRAVPGSNSSIRVVAMPHFISTNGTSIPSSSIDFTWKLNGATQKTQSGLGESSAVFPAAVLYGTDEIDVVARSADGSLSGEASVAVPTGDPHLVLYEDNPLFGVMYHQAISQSNASTESETSFAAVPYFANAASANDTSLAYQWTVNGAPVAADAQDPSEVTVDAQGVGVATIALSIDNPFDPFFSASGSWQIQFSGPAASSADAFHASTQ